MIEIPMLQAGRREATAFGSLVLRASNLFRIWGLVLRISASRRWLGVGFETGYGVNMEKREARGRRVRLSTLWPLAFLGPCHTSIPLPGAVVQTKPICLRQARKTSAKARSLEAATQPRGQIRQTKPIQGATVQTNPIRRGHYRAKQSQFRRRVGPGLGARGAWDCCTNKPNFPSFAGPLPDAIVRNKANFGGGANNGKSFMGTGL